MKKKIPYLILAVLLNQLILSCANKGTILGGPKDENPPEVVLCKPENFSRNISDTKIHIRFDEYFQLKDIKNQLIISPPLEEDPEIKAHGKDLYIDMNNELLENTTYTLNFGNAIVDLNEGNVLNNFLYVFSTGEIIDSLVVKGNVEDAFEGTAVENAFVMLYKEFYDSIPYKEIPVYISKTGKDGNFSINNIHEGSYKLFALKEANNNFLYDDKVNESIAFLDSLIILSPILFPDSLKLNMFKEETNDQYLTDSDRPEREKCVFIFNKNLDETLEFRLLEQNEPDNWFYYESNIANDSITCWIRDSIISNIDSLKFELSFMKPDKTGQKIIQKDTVILNFREIINNKQTDSEINKLNYSSNISRTGKLEPWKKIKLMFPYPVINIDSSGFDFFEISDSLETRKLVDFNDHLWFNDSKPEFIRSFVLPFTAEPEKKYKIMVAPGTFNDLYGKTNDSISISFTTQSLDHYGSVVLNISGVNSPGIIEVLKNKKNIVKTINVFEDGELTIAKLEPAGYLFRYIFDENNNGKWDA
ncbi:Ig-like domain-containing protein, partial [Bacteroidota bacterium]